jgi:hypothetical protein
LLGEEGAVMAAPPNEGIKEQPIEVSADQQEVAEVVRLAREQNLSLSGLVVLRDQLSRDDGRGHRAAP